jgi:uncharacterized Fe-S cluster-containing MiaB family protein
VGANSEKYPFNCCELHNAIHVAISLFVHEETISIVGKYYCGSASFYRNYVTAEDIAGTAVE